jgi:hypothetical protein
MPHCLYRPSKILKELIPSFSPSATFFRTDRWMKSFPLVVHQQDVLRETKRKNRVVNFLFFLQERRMMKRAEQQRSEYPR